MNKYLMQKNLHQRKNFPLSLKQEVKKFILNKETDLKIAFWDTKLSHRGTSIALYDYAYYNKHLLNNQSIIIYNNTFPENNDIVVEKFKKEFDVFAVDNFNKVENILNEQHCDILYIIKGGEFEGNISYNIKTVVHCVFNCLHPHGNVYATISPYIKGYVDNNFPVVPHMINLPDVAGNMRKELGIPDEAIVYGRHGGFETFDIEYVHKIVYEVAKKYNNIYFLFMSTNKFCNDLPNIIHLEPIIDVEKKVEFINTCDAMLWARKDGETFGLAIAEFSTKGKPVIATKKNILDLAHVHFLNDFGIWYDETNLYDILIHFNKEENSKKDWNAYKDFTPEKVMKQFKKVFIDN
jgi:hypothetical protein